MPSSPTAPGYPSGPSFIADLHIHSRFSMATSRQLNIPHLSGWAMAKGINVLGTGDFTHPKWREELKRDLAFDEASGFYRPVPAPERVLPQGLEEASPPLFCLQTEISSIYKKLGKVRKNHNVVIMPTLEDADRLSAKLGQIGNVNSDGRPILGLDAKDLLDLVLNVSDRAVLIPAHIWTPWFSLFGSKSGFDDIRDCFGDLTEHIFALETGLSSDPAMNRLVSALDGYALVSNSDAHSGPNLGRESNVFTGSPSYDGMIRALRLAALRTPDMSPGAVRFEGTLEIYPEEGKYHLDGHRNCHVVMTPEEAERHRGICPACGRKLTIGVMHRVWELADRKEEPALESEPAVHPVIPLPSVLAEIYGKGPATKKVQEAYAEALAKLGPEFGILASLPLDRIATFSDLLAEAVARIREGRLVRQGGYDGEFGTVAVFTGEERREMAGGKIPRARLGVPGTSGAVKAPPMEQASAAGSLLAMGQAPVRSGAGGKPVRNAGADAAFCLSGEQERAMRHRGRPLLVLAGPGSGKTRILTERLAGLIDGGADPGEIIALTFSRRAADEVNARLKARLPGRNLPECTTFHALAWRLIQERHPGAVLLADPCAKSLMKQALLSVKMDLQKGPLKVLPERIAFLRETCSLAADSRLGAVFQAYRRLLQEIHPFCFDFTGLLEWLRASLREGTLDLHPCEVLVDEVQDISSLQADALYAMLPQDGRGFFGIGDPDQAIYGFRGSTPDIRRALEERWPDLEVMALSQSYRASQQILEAAGLAMHSHPASGLLKAVRPLEAELRYFEAPSDQAEAVWIAGRIQAMLGATSHTLLDQKKAGPAPLVQDLAPSDIAVLVRLRMQMPVIARALRERGIPVQSPSAEAFWQDETTAGVLALVEQRLSKGTNAGAAGGQALAAAELPPEWASVLQGEGEPPAPRLLEEKLANASPRTALYLASEPWKRLARAWRRAGAWRALLDEVRWLDEAEMLAAKAEAVRLLTLHAAKGLEFRAVFMPGLEQGILPADDKALFGTGAWSDAPSREEERRLLYVGLTRASEVLCLSSARTRAVYGRKTSLEPSEFLGDILSAFKRTRLAAHTRQTVRQRGLFS